VDERSEARIEAALVDELEEVLVDLSEGLAVVLDLAIREGDALLDGEVAWKEDVQVLERPQPVMVAEREGQDTGGLELLAGIDEIGVGLGRPLL
jgi:hypothetical protein